MLFQRLLSKEQFKEAILKVFTNERSPLNAIEILEALTKFYMTYCAPKNLYEHPASLIRNHHFEGGLTGAHTNN